MHERCLLAWLGGPAGAPLPEHPVCEVCGTRLRTAVTRPPASRARFLLSAHPAATQLRTALLFLAAHALHLFAAPNAVLPRAVLGCMLVALTATLLLMQHRAPLAPVGAAALCVLALPCVGWLARTDTLLGAAAGARARALAAEFAGFRPVGWRDTALLTLLGAAAAPRVLGAVLLAGHGAVLAARAARHGCSLRGAWRHSGPGFRALTTLWAFAAAGALFWHARGHTAKAAAFALVVLALVLGTAAHVHVATDALSLLVFYAGALYFLCVCLGVLVVFAAPPAWRLLGAATAGPTAAAPLSLPLAAALRALSHPPTLPCLVPLSTPPQQQQQLPPLLSLSLPSSGVRTVLLSAAASCLPESYTTASSSSSSSSSSSTGTGTLFVVDEGVCPLEWKVRAAQARGVHALAVLMAAPGLPPAPLLPANTTTALFAVPWSLDARCRAALVPSTSSGNSRQDDLGAALRTVLKRGGTGTLVPSQAVRWDYRASPHARALAGLGVLTGRADYDCALVDADGWHVQCSARASPCHLANFVRAPRAAALRECHYGVAIHYLGFTAFIYLCVLLGVLFLAACLVYNLVVAVRCAVARGHEPRHDNDDVNNNDNNEPRFAPQAFFPDDFIRLHFAPDPDAEQEEAQEQQQEQAHASETETEVWLALTLLAAAGALCLVALFAPRGPRHLAAALVLAAFVCAVPCVQLCAALGALFCRWAARSTRVRICNYGPDPKQQQQQQQQQQQRLSCAFAVPEE